jgi:hypothetical protein
MAEKYEVVNNNTKEVVRYDDRGLIIFIKTVFPEGNTKFWNYLYTKRLKNSRIPYVNGIFTITCLNNKIKKHKNLNFASKFNLEPNENPNACSKKRYNQWTIFNKNTGMYETFHNLAALARSLNLKYAWLYSNIRYKTSFELKDYIFTFNTTLESEYYKEKLQKLV